MDEKSKQTIQMLQEKLTELRRKQDYRFLRNMHDLRTGKSLFSSKHEQERPKLKGDKL